MQGRAHRIDVACDADLVEMIDQSSGECATAVRQILCVGVGILDAAAIVRHHIRPVRGQPAVATDLVAAADAARIEADDIESRPQLR